MRRRQVGLGSHQPSAEVDEGGGLGGAAIGSATEEDQVPWDGRGGAGGKCFYFKSFFFLISGNPWSPSGSRC